MDILQKFGRCVYCFAEKEEDDICPLCGYVSVMTDPPGWWLLPGTVLNGRYVVGRPLASQAESLTYLGWDLAKDRPVEVMEYFPPALVTRNITASDDINCIPGREAALEEGKQAFFEKAKLYYRCVSRAEALDMDFFVRNGTCYYIRRKKENKRN